MNAVGTKALRGLICRLQEANRKMSEAARQLLLEVTSERGAGNLLDGLMSVQETVFWIS